MRQLVQYQGGGYDGCFWEWNFFYLDGDKFHDIYSSGRAGITTKEKALELLESEDNFYTYNLDDKKDLRETSVEINPVYLKGIVRWCDGVPCFSILATCSSVKPHSRRRSRAA